MSFECPNWQTKLYSRVHRVCRASGYLSELLLSEAEIRHHEEKLEREKKAKLEAHKNVDTSGQDISSIGGV
jgi:hypothetical protein